MNLKKYDYANGKTAGVIPGVCLAAAFITGSVPVAFLSGDANSSFYGMIFAALLGLILFFLFSKIRNSDEYKGIYELATARFSRFTACLLLIPLIAAVLLITSAESADYIRFIDTRMLKDTPRIIIAAVYAVVLYALSACEKTTMIKAALIGFIITSFSVAVMFLLAIPHMDFGYFKSLTPDNGGKIFEKFIIYSARIFAAGIFLSFFMSYIPRQKRTAVYVGGLLTGASVIIISGLNTVLMLRNDMVSALEYPYASAVGIITLGNIFTRLDGLLYYSAFLCTVVKASVLGHILRTLISKIFGLSKCISTAIGTAAIFVFCAVPSLTAELGSMYIWYFALAAELAALIFLAIPGRKKPSD